MGRPKTKTVFVCNQCGHREPKWLGRCPECEEWNTFAEIETVGKSAKSSSKTRPSATALSAIAAQNNQGRLPTGINELDRVLGGGVVPGLFALLGGEPGIGKSTLMLQAAARISSQLTTSVLYVSGEESMGQTAMRAERLGVAQADIQILAETNLQTILEVARKSKPSLLAIDSIQTLYLPDQGSHPGSMTQVRDCAGLLLQFAKETNTPTFLVGHVTKDGHLAGPKHLEHMVDVVLSFEGDNRNSFRLLRSTKNRFGSTQETGVFEMAAEGLREVTNPSQLFLAERPQGVPGSVVTASAEGNRTFLVEVQALVSQSGGGMARRTSSGFDRNRLSLLLAVLSQRAGLHIQDMDVYVNVAGGMSLREPAADLAIACAVASSLRNRPFGDHTLCFGEVGLSGEVRGVRNAEQRIAEAAQLGFRQCLLPRQHLDQLQGKNGIRLIGIGHLQDALAFMD